MHQPVDGVGEETRNLWDRGDRCFFPGDGAFYPSMWGTVLFAMDVVDTATDEWDQLLTVKWDGREGSDQVLGSSVYREPPV